MTATMTKNRISTHGPDTVTEHVCPYKKCNGREFKNAQALNMHIGRTHTGVIRTASSREVSEGLKAARNGHNRHSNLSADQVEQLVGFIAKYHDGYPTKKAAFDAALSGTGLTGKLKANSTAVDRYYKKAMKLAKNGGPEKKAKRKYTRRAKAEPTIPLLPVNPNGMECVITGPGLRIEFSAKILPTILHTIAMSIGAEK